MEYIVKLNKEYYVRICRGRDTSSKNKNQIRLTYTLWRYQPKGKRYGDVELSTYKSFIDAVKGMWNIKRMEREEAKPKKEKKYERVPYELFWEILHKLKLI